MKCLSKGLFVRESLTAELCASPAVVPGSARVQARGCARCPVPLPDLPLLIPPRRAKEIKTKLGTLLQKPDAAVDFIIPYPEKPEKPPKAQK